jgi:hypothetical protein
MKIALLTGRFSDRNNEAVDKEFSLVWKNPTNNFERNEINGFIDVFAMFSMDLQRKNDKDSYGLFVVWTNDWEVINKLFQFCSEFFHVIEGKIFKCEKADYEYNPAEAVSSNSHLPKEAFN